jgi:hypothetical protein
MGTPPAFSAPAAEYKRRLEARLATAAAERSRGAKAAYLRLAVAVVFVAAVWLVIGPQILAPWWLAAPVAVFIALAAWHARVDRRQRRAERAAAYFERALERLEDRWAGKGEAGHRFLDEHHPYAQDLDIFGEGSLFEMLCIARTRAGEATLANWLTGHATTDVIRARQHAVAELRSQLDLREDLAVLGEDVRVGVHPEPLAEWGERPPMLPVGAVQVAAALLVLAFVLAVVFGSLPGALLAFAAEAAFIAYFRRRIGAVVAGVELPAHDLHLLSEVLARFEREAFQSDRLRELRAELEVEGRSPSARIARLDRLMELLDSRDNVVVRIVDWPLMWTTQLAFAIESWRRTSGPALRRWLDAAGELEALSALAAYSYARPEDPFPEIVSESPLFDGEALEHPLLPRGKAVANDIRMDRTLGVHVVSGSNMSGKSTLLRTVGTNAVLAMAGAPVRARRLRMSLVNVGASIRVTDSLQAGASRFYAEITRLRQLLDMTARPEPLLFLLDELLHGTNSHDRRIGAEAVVRSFAERGAIGLLTTHDLALAHIADALGPGAQNVHFEDHLEDGRIRFDYRLRPGTVTKSNALELMRSVGLHV